jgi:hypothetical protein
MTPSRAASGRYAVPRQPREGEEGAMLARSVLFAVLVVPSIATAQSEVQWTRERDATLISKEVGAERWAITYRLSDGRVTGSVFRTDGGPPSFLECEQTSSRGATAVYDCYAAAACASAPCPGSQYTLAATGISLPLSFFFPPGAGPGPGAPSVSHMLGAWRFTWETSEGTFDRVFHIDDAEGDVASGWAEESGFDVVVAPYDGPYTRAAGNFVLYEEGDNIFCMKYVFRFLGLDRIEGSRWLTLRLPGDSCQDSPLTAATPFVGERIEVLPAS